MEETFRIGRFAGIRVGVNWSVLVVFWLIVWGLASRLPADYPGHAEETYWLAGAVAALVFYGALLAHELGHALTARRRGIPVEGITLWLFGGVTRMRAEATSPAGALRVALVGPLVSLAAAGLFGVLVLALDSVGAPALVEGMARWLARINLLLAAFNLVPAAPLDGGRVLQAVLWWRWGDRVAASVTAAQAGRAFGYVLVGLGLLDVLAGTGLGGLWFVFLGWFLVAAARTEQDSAEARVGLQGVRVADIMTADPVVVPGWLTVDAFVEDYALPHRLSAFPVRSFDGALSGLVTLDAVKRVPPNQRGAVRVEDLMVPVEHVAIARSDEMVLDVLERTSPPHARRALVIDDGRLVGVVSSAELTRALEIAALHGAGSRGHRGHSGRSRGERDALLSR